MCRVVGYHSIYKSTLHLLLRGVAVVVVLAPAPALDMVGLAPALSVFLLLPA